MSKKQNEITWQRFKAALNGSIDRAENRGFRMVGEQIVTYEQNKLGLSAYYDNGGCYQMALTQSRSSFTWAAAEY